MGTKLREADRSAKAEVTNSSLGAGAKYKLYTGTAPGTITGAPTGTLIATCIGNATGFGTVTAGVLNADNVAGQTYVARDDSADNTGDVGYVRITDSADNVILQLDSIGVTGSGAAVTLPNLSITAGEPVEVGSFALVEGGA